MKTSNSIRCAVVVAVLGLSAVLSAPHAFAAETDDIVYPADTCLKLSGQQNITRDGFGGIENRNLTGTLFVGCGFTNNVSLQIHRVGIDTTDRNPGPIINDNIICTLHQVRRNNDDSVTFWSEGRRTQGASTSLQTLTLGPADPLFTTGLESANFITCLIPSRTSPNSSGSQIHSYRVTEGPRILPPNAQERQARAGVEAQEMRVKQALATEKEDPEWSQSAVTAWTQVFQAEGIKEDLKGIPVGHHRMPHDLLPAETDTHAPPARRRHLWG